MHLIPVGTRFKGTPAQVRALDAYIKLIRAANSVGGRLDRRLAEVGVTESQLGVLEMVLHHGPLCQRAISEKMFSSGSNVSLVIDNLEKRGLVERRRSEEDRRQVIVDLTGEGRALIERIFPRHVQHIVEEFEALTSEEAEVLGRLLKKVGKRPPADDDPGDHPSAAQTLARRPA